jgi:hypothetical protein
VSAAAPLPELDDGAIVATVPMDPTDVRLVVSGFRNLHGRHPNQATVTWARLRQRLTRFEVVSAATKEERGLVVRTWSPVMYRDGATRGIAGVELVSCIVLDIDSGESIETARAPWTHVAHVVHTSWSHTPEHPRFRVVIPLAVDVPIAGWPRVWHWAAQRAGVQVDPKCKDAARMYFVPAIRSADWPHEAHVHAGPILYLDAGRLAPTPEECAAAEAARTARERAAQWKTRRPSRREFSDALKTDPGLRRQAGELLGGRCDGHAMRDVPCPACGRPSLYWFLVPTTTPRALCRHRNSCGASFWLDELELPR